MKFADRHDQAQSNVQPFGMSSFVRTIEPLDHCFAFVGNVGAAVLNPDYGFTAAVLWEIARLTPGGPLCRLAALKKISATAAKDATSTAPENA